MSPGWFEVKRLFQSTFKSPPSLVTRAPGRLELLGNHTDYNRGLVMALTINRELFLAATPRIDGRVSIVSSAFPGAKTFFADALGKDPSAPWLDYVKGVLSGLRKRGVGFGGFNAAIHSEIPLGAGLSSSAALEVSVALTVRALYPFGLSELGVKPPPKRARGGKLPAPTSKDKMLLAQLCQEAENDYVGVRSGFLDQVSILFGREERALVIDCLHRSVEHAPFPGGVAVVVCDSGVQRRLADGEYNRLREHCEAAARKLRVESLRRATVEDVRRRQELLDKREFECALHITGENRRVAAGERALRAGDAGQFGQYLTQSHESSRDLLKNSCPELDVLAGLAQAQPGCLGARLTGGGFGGATLSLVEAACLPAFLKELPARFHAETGRTCRPWVCRIVSGAE